MTDEGGASRGKRLPSSMVLLSWTGVAAAIVGIRSRINHMKLNKHTQRLLFIAKHAYRTL
jgi:hypothetical protein